MNLGTFVVTAILVIIVAAIIASMVRSHRAGKHIGCDECGGCSCGDPSQMTAQGANCGCANMDTMIKHMDERGMLTKIRPKPKKFGGQHVLEGRKDEGSRAVH